MIKAQKLRREPPARSIFNKRFIALGAAALLFLAGGIVMLALDRSANADAGIRHGAGKLAVGYEYEYTPNDLYTQPKPGEKEVRLAAYVKDMRFKLAYTLTGLEDYAASSEISAQAVLIAHANDTNKYVDPDFVVWQKEYELLKPEKIDASKPVEKTVIVDVNKYMKYASGVYEATQASTSNELRVRFLVNTTVQGPMGPVTDVSTVEYTIPMLDNLIIVQGTPEQEKKIDVGTKPAVKRIGLLPFALAALALSLGIGVRLALPAMQRQKPDSASLYRKKLDKIFHQYGERLVRLQNPLQGEGLAVIPIAGIVEMVKIADEIRQPVLYFRVDADEESGIDFYVFDTGRIYRTQLGRGMQLTN